MPNKTPLNDLERCLAKSMRSKSAVPDFYRQLLISPLWFLLPYHPEMEGKMKVGNGDNFTLSMWNNGTSGDIVPLFTAEERVFECMKKIGREDEPTCIGMVDGQLIVHILGTESLKAVLNPACCTGELFLFPEAMKGLMDGSLLNPMKADGPTKEVEFIVIDPSEYPTELVQPLFEYMRLHPAFRAAWIFKQSGEPEPGYRNYHLGLLMEPEDNRLLQDLIVVLRTVLCSDGVKLECDVAILDPKHPSGQAIIHHMVPFFAALDFKQTKPRKPRKTNVKARKTKAKGTKTKAKPRKKKDDGEGTAKA